MKIRFTGIHNSSQYDVNIEHQLKTSKPKILVARLAINAGKRLGSNELPLMDHYRPIKGPGGDAPEFVKGTVLKIEAGGYARIHDFYLVDEKQPLIFSMEDEQGKAETALQINMLKDTYHTFLEYRSKSGEVLHRIDVGDTDADYTLDLYLSVSETLGFLLEPMDDNSRHLKLEATKLAPWSYSYLKGKINRVYLSVGNNSRVEFDIYLLDLKDKAKSKTKEADKIDPIKLGCFLTFEEEKIEDQLRKHGGNKSSNVLYGPDSCLTVKDEKTGRTKAMGKFYVLLTQSFVPVAQHDGLSAAVKIDSLLRLENDKENKVIEWKLKQAPESKHEIDSKTGKIKLKKESLGQEVELIARVEIRFEIKLSEDFPQFLRRNGRDLPWLVDSDGQRSVQYFYAVYIGLDEKLKQQLKNMLVFRANHSEESSRYNILSNYLIMNNEDLKLKPEALADKWMTLTSHALITNKLSDLRAKTSDIFSALLTYQFFLSNQMMNPLDHLPPMLFVRILPNFIMSYLTDLYAQVISSLKDDVREFSKIASWEMHNFEFKTVPLLGWFCSTFLGMPPNFVFSILARNPYFKYYFGLENKVIKDNNWEEAGMSSVHASGNPIFDLGESISATAMHEDVLAKLKPVKIKPDEKRQTFVNKTYLGSKWKKLDIEQFEYYTDVTFSSDYQYVTLLDVSSGAEHAEKQKLEMAEQVFEILSSGWETEVDILLQEKRKLLNELYSNHQAELAQSIGFARVSEKYGEGLQPFEGTEHRSEPGDMLLDRELMLSNQGIWMIGETDRNTGRARELFGAMDLGQPINNASFQKPFEYFTLFWRPSQLERIWPNAAQSAYPNLNQSLSKLIDLWGLEKHAESKRSLQNPGNFFDVFLDLSEMRIPELVFPEKDPYINMINYMHLVGEGLNYYNPEKTVLEPGDLIIPYHENTVGVVLRLRGEDTVDVLMSGGHAREKRHFFGIGETINMVKLIHAYEKENLKYFWRPSLQLKQFYQTSI